MQNSKTMPAELNTVRQIFRVDRRRINLIKFIFEAYEGLAVVTTLDPSAGIIALRVAPGCEETAGKVILDLSKKFLIEPIEEDSAPRRKEETK